MTYPRPSLPPTGVMAITLEQVEKQCPQQLLEFVTCVEANPTSWQSLCEDKVNPLSLCNLLCTFDVCGCELSRHIY
jgi:hypothetical protein